MMDSVVNISSPTCIQQNEPYLKQSSNKTVAWSVIMTIASTYRVHTGIAFFSGERIDYMNCALYKFTENFT